VKRVTQRSPQKVPSRGDARKVSAQPMLRAQIRDLTNRVVRRQLCEIRPYPNNPRRHPEVQIARLMKNIERMWMAPIFIADHGTILAGHARAEAAKRLGMAEVPTITIVALTEAEKRAIVIADNRLAKQAEWNIDLLREHFKGLINNRRLMRRKKERPPRGCLSKF
jgi:hypothetical protein